MSYTAKAAQHKKDELAKISTMLEEYPIIGILNVENLGAAPLAVLRNKLRNDVVIRMTKKHIIKKAIDSQKKQGISELKESVVGMPALLLTKENPFKVSKLIKESKSKAPAKAGQTAPYDLIIPAGPTQFAPGPIISELGQAGLKTGVEDGKITIKADKVIAKKDDVITQQIADLLAKFDIQPMEIGLDLVAAYEDGVIYGKDVLSIDPAEYIDSLKSCAAQTFALSIEIGYPTKENIKNLIGKTFNTSKNFAIENSIICDAWTENQIEKAQRAANLIIEKGNIDLTPVPDETSKEAKSEGVKPEDGKSEGVKPEDGKSEGVKPEDGKSEGVKPEDGKSEGVKPEEKKEETQT